MAERREGLDPTREARALGARIAERMNNEKSATREDARAELLLRDPAHGEVLGVSQATAEARRGDEHVELEKHERNAWRENCLSAICARLEERGTPLSEHLQMVLAVVMERVPGEWNQYDGDPEGVDLGKIEFDTASQTITIRFESWGEMIGKHIIRLALT